MYEPRYIITHEMLKNIGKIEAAREIIDHSALVPAWDAKFREEALSRSIHHGTHIEGNALSLEQAKKLIRVDEPVASKAAEKAGIVGRDRDIQEVINYRKVLEWIDHWGRELDSNPKYTEAMVKDLHKVTVERIMSQEQSGIYRRVEVVVKNSATNEVSFKPPPFVEVPYHMNEFIAWLNGDDGKDHHPIIRAGITHYELARIHPFVDGNGRVARAVATLVLYSEGFNVKQFFSLEEYFDLNAASYYQALQSVGEGEDFDLTYWLEYFTLGLSAELDRVKQQVLKLSRDLGLKKKLGKQVALTERQIVILEAMQNNAGIVKSGELGKILPQVSIDTVLRDIKDLINKKLIKKKGKTKGAYYELRD
jgi:Fic family protein